MINKLILIINIIVSFLLGISYIASFIRPETFWIIPLIGLAYPIFLALNICFLLFWLFFKPKYGIISLFFIVIGWTFHKRYFTYNSIKEEKPNSIKVMSYNVKNFDVYNYTPDWKYQFENRNKMFEILKEENPDIICFQEYFYEKTKKFKTTDTISTFIDAKYKHIELLVENRKTNYFGIATYSKYPIVNKGKVDLASRNINTCIYTDILYQKDTIRIYNLHFESIHFKKEEYQFAKDISTNPGDKTENEIKQHTKSIIKKLKIAFEYRSNQAELVAAHIAKCKYPVILCGDFNDTPISYAYHQISHQLKDAFIKAGKGIGTTYAGKEIPAYRIDYIFHSTHFVPYNYRKIQKDCSDHYPIVSFFEYKKANDSTDNNNK